MTIAQVRAARRKVRRPKSARPLKEALAQGKLGSNKGKRK